MSEDPKRGNSGDTTDIELGEPIKELAGFEHETSEAFLAIVRSKIQRRSTVSQVASFTWNVPRWILTEFWNALIHIIDSRVRKGKETMKEKLLESFGT